MDAPQQTAFTPGLKRQKMPKTKSTKTSVGRLGPLWIFLSLLVGMAVVSVVAPYAADGSREEAWRTFAGVLASVAATMTGLLAAVTAVFYAVYQAPLMKMLHETGHDRRILFHLFAASVVWLCSLLLALTGCIPGADLPVRMFALASLSFAVAGALAFGPIGYSFWTVLSRINSEPRKPSGHDWDSPTDLT